MDDDMETTRLKLEDVNKNLLCGLCDGYLIDATTIIECLHSFCRTCIVTYLKTSKSCPKCETLVHKTRPHLNIRSDKLLQDLVYKIVPGLYKDEMKRRREFYTIHFEDAPKRASEERGDEMSDRFIFTQEELISLALHYCPNNNNERSFHRIFKTKEEFKTRLERRSKDSIHIRYFQCKAAVCVRHLKKLIRLKYDLPPNYQIDMFYNEESLRDGYSLADVALCYNWRRKSPLKLYFSMYEMTMQKVAVGEEVPKLSHSSGLRWQQPPPTPSPPPPPPAPPAPPALPWRLENDNILSARASTTITTSLPTPIVSSSPIVSSTPTSLPSSSSSTAAVTTQPPRPDQPMLQPPSDPSTPSTPIVLTQSNHLDETLETPPPPAKKFKSSTSISNSIAKDPVLKPKIKSKVKQEQQQQQQMLSSTANLKPITTALPIAPAGKPIQVSVNNTSKLSTTGSKKKSLLGKRHHASSNNTPILIAPAPSKKERNKNNVQQRQHQQPILRMAKFLKLSNDSQGGVSGHNSAPPTQPTPSLSTTNQAVSFIPITLSTMLPPGSSSTSATAAASLTASRQPGAPGVTTTCLHPAFMNGYFQSITNNPNTPNIATGGLAPTTIRITPTGIAVPIPPPPPQSGRACGFSNPRAAVLSPMSPAGFNPASFVQHNSNNNTTPSTSSQYQQCIAKTMSSLSLTSPPGSRCATTIASLRNFNPSSSSSTSFPYPTPSNPLLSTTIPPSLPNTAFPPAFIRATAVCAPTLPFSSTATTLPHTSVSLSSSSSSSSSSQAVSVSTSASATSPTPAASASPTPAAVPSQQSQTQGTDSSNHQLIPSSTSSSLSSSSSSSSMPSKSSVHPSITNLSNSNTCNNSSHPNPLTNGQLVQVKIETQPHSNSSFESDSFSKNTSDSTQTITPVPELKTPIKHCPSSPPPLVITPAKSTPSPTSSSFAPNTSPSSGSGQSRKICKSKTIADIANTLHQRMSATLQQNQNGPNSSQQNQMANGSHSNSQNQNGSIVNTSLHQNNGHIANRGSPSVSSPNPKTSTSSASQQSGKPTNGFLDIKLSLPNSQQPSFNPASLLLSTSQIMSSNPAFNIKKETGMSVSPTLTPTPHSSTSSSRPNPPSNLFLGMPTTGLYLRPPSMLFDHRTATNLMHQHQQLQNARVAALNGQQTRLEEQPLNLVTRDKDFSRPSPPSASVGRQKMHPIVK